MSVLRVRHLSLDFRELSVRPFRNTPIKTTITTIKNIFSGLQTNSSQIDLGTTHIFSKSTVDYQMFQFLKYENVRDSGHRKSRRTMPTKNGAKQTRILREINNLSKSNSNLSSQKGNGVKGMRHDTKIQTADEEMVKGITQKKTQRRNAENLLMQPHKKEDQNVV